MKSNAVSIETVKSGNSRAVSAIRLIGGAALLALVGGCAVLSSSVSTPLLLVGAAVGGVSVGASTWKKY